MELPMLHANITPSQQKAIDELKTELPHKNYELQGFMSEPIIGSKNILAMREYGKDKVKYYESYVIGPRGKINAKTVLPFVRQ